MNFPVKPVLREIEKFAALGFDYLELAMDPPQAHYTGIRRQKKDICKALKAHSMGLVCHLPTFVYTADLTERIRSASLIEMFKSLETAAMLEPLKVVVHPGGIGGLAVFDMDSARELVVESLSKIVEKANQLGLYLCLENMFPGYRSFVEPEAFKTVFGQYPDLMLTLDIGHAGIDSRRGNRIFDFIKLFGHRIGHVHVSDNLGHGDDHLPVGEGSIPFPKVIKALQKAGYNDTMTLEVFSEQRGVLKKSRDKIAAMTNFC
jgi:sugar phosphate isomerase/epimerase